MIRVVIELDIDDAIRIGADRRSIVAHSPEGYAVSKLLCLGWGRNFATGAVTMDFGFTVTSPADLLPRVEVYGTGSKK